MFKWATELKTPGSQPATHHPHPKPAAFQDRSASRRATGAHSGQGCVRAAKARGRAKVVFGTRLPPHLLLHFMVPGNDPARGNSRVFLLQPFTLQLGALRLRDAGGKQAECSYAERPCLDQSRAKCKTQSESGDDGDSHSHTHIRLHLPRVCTTVYESWLLGLLGRV